MKTTSCLWQWLYICLDSRTHENGIYKTYVGNPFYDELRNIDDETDTKNWTQESMHTLEGGKTAFYDRKDIYESGKQSD